MHTTYKPFNLAKWYEIQCDSQCAISLANKWDVFSQTQTYWCEADSYLHMDIYYLKNFILQKI